MHKKLITMCVAIAAFAAFVVAPVASASPVLTSEGKAVAVGTELKGNNTGLFHFNTPTYTILCSSVSLTGTVTSNSGTKINIEVPSGGLVTSGTAPGGDCTTNWEPATLTWSKLCIQSGSNDTATVTGCGANVTMTTNVTGLGICKYTVPNEAWSFTTNADATFAIKSLFLKRSEGTYLFCPTEITYEFDLDLTTAAGGTLLIS